MEKDPLTYEVIGCAMKVYNKMGPGFQEVIYQRCLAIELGRAGLSYVRELDHNVYYDDIEVGTRRADFIVEEILTVELKAKVDLEAANLAQAKNYTKAYDYPKGLLFNFGSTSLQYKLLFNPKYNDPDYVKPKTDKFKLNHHYSSGQLYYHLNNGKCPHCGQNLK